MPARRIAPQRLARREFLLGAAGVVVLAACSDGSDEQPTGAVPVDGTSLLPMFNAAGPFLVSGVPQRAPFTIGDGQALPNPDAAPASITLRLLAEDETTQVLPPTSVEVHRDGVPTPYYPYRFEVAEPGTYTVETTVEGTTLTAAFAVVERGAVEFPLPGSTMPSVATPTVADARGVDPICTASPQCPLHARSLDEVLAAGRPVAALVATPQFCHTAACGPVLDLLLEAAEREPGLDMVHIEVYESGTAAQEGEGTPAPAVRALGLDFEPVLFVVGADGIVRDTVASLLDRAEIADALSLIT